MWIARDKDGFLMIGKNKPMICEECEDRWTWIGLHSRIPSSLFEDVTFENSPQEIGLTIKEE